MCGLLAIQYKIFSEGLNDLSLTAFYNRAIPDMQHSSSISSGQIPA
ncbi:MAG TPA: hypothetical protein VEF53_12340 [Patescibacteria group bacterium]|nr:hypothetical protein [Patescibacteria group bacterium]